MKKRQEKKNWGKYFNLAGKKEFDYAKKSHVYVQEKWKRCAKNRSWFVLSAPSRKMVDFSICRTANDRAKHRQKWKKRALRARSRRLACRHLGRLSSRRLGNLHRLPPAPVAPVPVTPRHRLRGLQCTKALMICRPLLSLTKAYASTTAASQIALHCTG